MMFTLVEGGGHRHGHGTEEPSKRRTVDQKRVSDQEEEDERLGSRIRQKKFRFVLSRGVSLIGH